MYGEENKMKILEILEKRFYEDRSYHKHLMWDEVLSKLQNQEVLDAISYMEKTKGEPRVFLIKDKIAIIDAFKEHPNKRLSLCYDEKALKTERNNPPKASVEGMIKSKLLRLLTEEEYMILQTYDLFDLKSSSWLDTPVSIRSFGGALFGDRKYNKTFIYHDSADSYFSNRGFRTIIYL